MAQEKNVLITGGSDGIGLELAKIFAKNGYNLILVARKKDELEKAAEKIKANNKVKVVTIPTDLFDPDNAFKLYDEIKSRGIQVDILVNDAGQGHYGLFLETDIMAELDIINLNISSLVILTKLYVKEMAKRGKGKILNLSSIASQAPGPYQIVYHGTKAFVQLFTEGLRNEVKDKGIVVTALLPGATDTDFFRKAGMGSSKIVQEGKLADPAKVAMDGYEALMNNEDKIVSGFKNKLQVEINKLSSDEKNAEKMSEMQEPA